MTEAATAWAVAGLCLVQGAAGAAALAGWRRPALWAALLVPLGVLGILALRDWPPWTELKPLEIAFLVVNVVSACLALVSLRGAAPSRLRLAAHWLLNTAACAVMVYLAFFFRLF